MRWSHAYRTRNANKQKSGNDRHKTARVGSYGCKSSGNALATAAAKRVMVSSVGLPAPRSRVEMKVCGIPVSFSTSCCDNPAARRAARRLRPKMLLGVSDINRKDTAYRLLPSAGQPATKSDEDQGFLERLLMTQKECGTRRLVFTAIGFLLSHLTKGRTKRPDPAARPSHDPKTTPV